jgi:PAS domain S-box-containing protein
VRYLSTARTKEDALLLGVALAAAVAAAASARAAMPQSLGLWITTAAALALALGAAFAFWLGGEARRVVSETLFGEWDAARNVLSAIPDGLLVVHQARVQSVNRRLCELLGFEREELLGAGAPFPFWPPEHRHEIEAWHAELEAAGAHDAELTLRTRSGERLHVLVAGRTVVGGSGASRHLVTVRDISRRRRHENRLGDLASRDPDTGLLNRREFEERLADGVRRALATGTNVTVVLAELAVDGRANGATFRRPKALVAVERLRALARAGDELARTRDAELAWILPDTNAHGGTGAIARARTELATLGDVTLTVGICDLPVAGDAFALYALADRALAEARRQGIGGTVQYAPSSARRERD